MFVSLAEYKHAVYVTQKNGWMMSMWADKIEYIWHRNHAERGRKYDLAHDTRYKFDEVLVLVYVYVYKEYSKRIEVVVELTKPTKPKQRARRSSSNTHTYQSRDNSHSYLVDEGNQNRKSYIVVVVVIVVICSFKHLASFFSHGASDQV